MKQEIPPKIKESTDRSDFQDEIESYLDQFFNYHKDKKTEILIAKNDLGDYIKNKRESLDKETFHVFCEESFYSVSEWKTDNKEDSETKYLLLNFLIENIFTQSYPNPKSDYEKNIREKTKENTFSLAAEIIKDKELIISVFSDFDNSKYNSPLVILLKNISKEFLGEENEISDKERRELITDFINILDTLEGFDKENIGEYNFKKILDLNSDYSIEVINTKLKDLENKEDIQFWSKHLTLLEIEKSLETRPDLFNRLLTEYSKITKNAEKESDNLVELYNQSFFGKQIDKNRANYAILKNAFISLRGAVDELKYLPDDEKDGVVDELTLDLKRFKKVKSVAIKSLISLDSDLDLECQEISSGLQYDDLVDVLGNPEKYNNPGDLRKAIDSGEIIYWWKEAGSLEEKIKNFDSSIIEKIIKNIENGNENIKKENKSYFDLEKTKNNTTDPSDLRVLKNIKKDIEIRNEIKKRFEKLKEIKSALEDKLDSFVYGEDNNDDVKSNADRVFVKFEEIINQAQKTSREDLEQFFSTDAEVNDDDVEKIVDLILEKANKFLKDSLSEASLEENESEIIEKLNSFRTDTAIFGSIFQAAYKENSLSFEEIRGINYTSLDAKDLDEEQKEMIRKLVKSNYSKKTQREDVLEKIEESFKSENNSRWHFLLKEENGEDELLSCIRFDEIDENSVYGASFNVDRAYQGFNIGEAMNNRVLDEVAKEKRIFAIAEIQKKVTKSYLNKGGFNVSGIEKNKKTGIYYYNIERYDPENEFYSSKKTKDEILMSYYDSNKKIKEQINFQKYILIKKEDKNFDNNIKEIISLIDNNYLMTRIITQQEGSSEKNYYVFEKRINMGIGKDSEAA